MAATTNSDSNCQDSNNTQANDNATAATITCGKGGKTGNRLEALWSKAPDFKMKPGTQKAMRDQLRTWIAKNLLLFFTFSGVSLGILLGICLRPHNLDPQTIVYISYPGELFMRLLKLMILPLIIASLITGAASLNAKMNGMIALRTVSLFLVTSLISAIIGLVLVILVHPGNTETKETLGAGQTEERKIDIADAFLDLGRNLFPDNIFKASFMTASTKYVNVSTNEKVEFARQLTYRSGTNTLGIIFFCLTFGTVLGSLGSRAKPVIEFFSVIDKVIMSMVYGIMWISPIGISSVICAKILSVANLGVVMSQLFLFIVTVVSGIFFYQFTVLQAIYFVFVRKNPFKFWWGLFQSWMTAFATASTAAALPVTFRCMRDNNRVDERISKFVLPIGATVNMDGTAIFVTVASVFIAQMNDIQLNSGDYVTVVLTATATSVAAASVPSAALVLMLIVLTAIDAPYQDVSLLWAIDWFVDRCRTTNNMLGDAYCAAIVEALSKDDLARMDKEKELEEGMGEDDQLIDNMENGSKHSKESGKDDDESNTKMTGVDSPCANSLNGSACMVPEVIVVDTNQEEDNK